MDERFRGRRGLWLGLGALVIISLCLIACLIGVAATAVLRSEPAYGVMPPVQPPAGEEGGTALAPYHGYGFFGPVHRVGHGLLGVLGFGVGLLFKLLFFGLLLLLLVGLVKRLFWGHWRRHAPYWGKPPEGEGGQGPSQAAWGPWSWHHHGGPPPWWGEWSRPAADAGAEGERGGEPAAEE